MSHPPLHLSLLAWSTTHTNAIEAAAALAVHESDADPAFFRRCLAAVFRSRAASDPAWLWATLSDPAHDAGLRSIAPDIGRVVLGPSVSLPPHEQTWPQYADSLRLLDCLDATWAGGWASAEPDAAQESDSAPPPTSPASVRATPPVEPTQGRGRGKTRRVETAGLF